MPTPETVIVALVDEQTTPQPLDGVLVRIFDVTGTTFIAQGVTGAVTAGEFEFTLDGDPDPNPIRYTVRLSKPGVAFDGGLGTDNQTPQYIDIYSPASGSPTGTNNFEMQGNTFQLPNATDARLCRASGYFRRPNGQPLKNLDILFVNQFNPAIVDSFGVLGQRIDIRTDNDGYAQVDLYRNGKYKAAVQSIEDIQRNITVPNLPAISIVDLLFPVIESVVFSPTSLNMSVDDVSTVTTTVTSSDQNILVDGDGAQITANLDVTYTIADTTIAVVVATTEKLTITALAVGSTQLDVTRTDETIVVIPDTGITYTPLTITVS